MQFARWVAWHHYHPLGETRRVRHPVVLHEWTVFVPTTITACSPHQDPHFCCEPQSNPAPVVQVYLRPNCPISTAVVVPVSLSAMVASTTSVDRNQLNGQVVLTSLRRTDPIQHTRTAATVVSARARTRHCWIRSTNRGSSMKKTRTMKRLTIFQLILQVVPPWRRRAEA